MISAILTINGHSESVGGDQISLVENYNESDGDPANDFSQSVQLAQDFTDDGLTEVQRRFLGFAFANALVIPVDLETAFSLDLLPPDTGGGSFVLTSYDHILGQSNYYANGSLNPTHLTVSRFGDVAAVPLPAALPLLLSGIAGLGILSRRRRSKAAA